MNQHDSPDVLSSEEVIQPKLPAGLNVLTILTFIGCVYELYSSISNYMSGDESLKEIEKSHYEMADAPGWLRNMTGPDVQAMMGQALENAVPLLVISLVSIGLCIFGALQMRKLKKQGYTLWLIGELLPYACMAFFLPLFFKTVYAYMIIIPVIFIILYTVQRKHLRY